jgi:hypothetical protein
MFIVFGYLFGALSYSHQLWPINVVISFRNTEVAQSLAKNFDDLGAFSNITNRREVPCPSQDVSTAVILVLGQSNSANHAEKKFSSNFPTQVLNYYMGKCYSAQSPLLGASGLEGEYLTLLGDALIKKGDLENVILVNKSIGGSVIVDWVSQGDLSLDLVSTLNELNSKYIVTHVIWHHGESDFLSSTSFREYRESFQELKSILKQARVTAPISIIVSTICGYNSNWLAENPIASAQKSLINDRDTFLGIDADSTLLVTDRRSQSPSQEPNCHLNEQGQRKVARLLSDKIMEIHNFQAAK